MKINKLKFPLPVDAEEKIDEGYMKKVATKSPYWQYLEKKYST